MTDITHNGANKTDAGNGSYGECHVIDASGLPSAKFGVHP
jgi:hypothetical protein